MTHTEEIKAARYAIDVMIREASYGKMDAEAETLHRACDSLEREPAQADRIAALEERLRLARRACGDVHEGQNAIDLSFEVMDAIDGRNQ